jgi:anti-sigma factor RsiW
MARTSRARDFDSRTGQAGNSAMKNVMWIVAPVLAAVAFLSVSKSTAQAQTLSQTQPQTQQCDQRARVIGHLAQKYKEAPVAIGVTSTGGMVEVLTTGDGGTWTIILSNPNGTSCLVAAGEGWRALHFDRTEYDPQV